MDGVKEKKVYSKENIVGFLYGFCIFLLCDPYFVWGTGKFNIYVAFIAFVISLFYLRRMKPSDFIIIPLFLFSFIYLYHASNFYGIISKLIFITFVLIKEKQILNFANWFKTLFVISLALSLIIYVLVVFLSIPISYNIIPPLNVLKPNNYVQYPFLVSEGFLGFRYFNIRFSGMFDEPGVVGSIAAILLISDNYNLKDKKNIILFIAGIFSFSFYFIVSSIIYLLYMAGNRFRLMILIIFFLAFFITRNDAIVNYLIWDRFTIENGQLKGDNRSSEGLDATYTQFVNSNDYLWGKGSSYTKDNNLLDNCSYKLLVINYGMVFFISVCLSFSLYAYFVIKKRKYVIGFLFIFFGMIYQRPGLVLNPSLYFVIIACIYLMKQNISNTDSQIKKL